MADDDLVVIGAGAAGLGAARAALSMRAGTVVGRLAQTVHACPTWSLSTRTAAASLSGRGPRTSQAAST